MALRIKSPVNSFVQFNQTDVIDSCEFSPFTLCLPVFADNDVFFQFIIIADTEEEADALCDLHNSAISIGIVESCDEDMILEFDQKPERFRIGATQVLYNWQHGLPNFSTVISKGGCFRIKIAVQGIYTLFDFCSNCFERIADTCHTSVIEYGNDDNAYGFDYCGGTSIDSGIENCDPLIIEFTNRVSIAIPYTSQLQAKYGSVPTVQTWIYDEGSELVDAGLRASFDMFPPTVISIDFGGNASGIIKIS